MEMYRKKTRVSLKDLKCFICIEDENQTRYAMKTISKQNSAANMFTHHKPKPKPVKETVIVANGGVADMLKVGNATLVLSSESGYESYSYSDTSSSINDESPLSEDDFNQLIENHVELLNAFKESKLLAKK
ncbi:hypothetical protein KSP39_PZI007423 [Platanthera zijinensis]|uniref:Uncharacterized protein n=1 Tax=Platanthera zijinensis TaxID=2320716 RepID=A0AAP0G9H0_9ASPA